MDKPIFQTTYTLTLNDYGGIENDFTVTRVADDEFLIVTGASATKYVLSLLKSITTTHLTTEHTDSFKDLSIRLD
jgi:glycine cleavage system aminomethyltransferase T